MGDISPFVEKKKSKTHGQPPEGMVWMRVVHGVHNSQKCEVL